MRVTGLGVRYRLVVQVTEAGQQGGLIKQDRSWELIKLAPWRIVSLARGGHALRCRSAAVAPARRGAPIVLASSAAALVTGSRHRWQ
jgi:hypothetical protein